MPAGQGDVLLVDSVRDEPIIRLFAQAVTNALGAGDETMSRAVAQRMDGHVRFDLDPFLSPSDGAAIRARRVSQIPLDADTRPAAATG